MSKIKEARDWLKVARDNRKTKKVRYAAINSAIKAKAEAKTSWKKIEADLSLEAIEELRTQIKTYRRGNEPRVPKEGVCKMVRELLLETDLAYASIRQMALAKFPEANTSTKSIASLARDMKKKGIAVPPRKGKAHNDNYPPHEADEADEEVGEEVEDLLYSGIFSPHGDPAAIYL
jgi:hypothetical protein